MKYKSIFIISILLFILSCKDNTLKDDSVSQPQTFINKNEVNRIEPPNWWTGFKSDSLQLLVHHTNISEYNPSINYRGVTIEKITKRDNSNNYLFIFFVRVMK